MTDVTLDPRVTTNGFSPTQSAALPTDDPRLRLIGRPISSIAPGTPSGTLLGLIHRSISDSSVLNLRDLPPEVAQAILTSQNEAISEQLKSWAESIAHNAAQDREADQRRQLLAQVINRAVNAGAITPDQAGELRARAGIREPEASPPPPDRRPTTNLSPGPSALATPSDPGALRRRAP